MSKKVYPSTRYHADGRTMVVSSAAEDEELVGWADTPAAFTDEDRVAATPVPAEEHAKVVETLEAIKLDYADFFKRVKACKDFKEVNKVLADYED